MIKITKERMGELYYETYGNTEHRENEIRFKGKGNETKIQKIATG